MRALRPSVLLLTGLLTGCTPVVHIDMTYHPEWIHCYDIPQAARDRSLRQLRQAASMGGFAAGMSELMRGTVTCGPFLWQSLRDLPEAASLIGSDVQYRIKVPLPDGTTGTEQFTGQRIYSETDQRIFCMMLQQAIVGTSGVVIREPEAHELRLLWRHKGVIIRRPFYVIETPTTSLIVNMEYDSGRRSASGPNTRVSAMEATLTYIDDLTAYERTLVARYFPSGKRPAPPSLMPQTDGSDTGIPGRRL